MKNISELTHNQRKYFLGIRHYKYIKWSVMLLFCVLMGGCVPIPDRTNECIIDNDVLTYSDKMNNDIRIDGARRQTISSEQRKEARALIEKILEKI